MKMPSIHLICWLLLSSFHCTSSTQITDTIREKTDVFYFECRDKKVTIDLPAGYKVQRHQYEEGYFVAALYPDSSYVQCHCGSAVQLPLLKGDRYILTDSKETPVLKSKSGKVNGTELYWREDKHKYFIILYNNVKEADRLILDQLFDEIQ